MDPSQYTLLVVDDNELNRDMLSRRLEGRGFRVLVADDGGPAIAVVESRHVDLVLLDITMPGIDGLQVLRRIRELYGESELPVIMATAKAESDNVVEALDLGANDYVTKPLDFSVVLARIQAQLRAREGRRPAKPPPPDRVPTTPAPGLVLAGKYELRDPIGTGNFGAVFRARHLELGADVAVKVLRPNLSHGEEALARFRREGMSAYRLRHPATVAVHDFGVTDAGVAYLVMELLEGTSLGRALASQGGRFPPRRAVAIAREISEVLALAHAAGIVHRDVKPENVFLHQSSQGEQVKVLDFGIAKLVGDTVAADDLTTDGSVLGTPSYMAPDRLNQRPVDGRADVYSVGVVLFQMLAGRLPFPADGRDPMVIIMQHMRDEPPHLAELVPDLDRGLADLVARTLAKEPEDRPDAAELARELGRYLARDEAWGDDATVAAAVVPPWPAPAAASADGGGRIEEAPTVTLRGARRGLVRRVVGTLRELFTVDP